MPQVRPDMSMRTSRADVAMRARPFRNGGSPRCPAALEEVAGAVGCDGLRTCRMGGDSLRALVGIVEENHLGRGSLSMIDRTGRAAPARGFPRRLRGTEAPPRRWWKCGRVGGHVDADLEC